jgi:hypothetical protein
MLPPIGGAATERTSRQTAGLASLKPVNPAVEYAQMKLGEIKRQEKLRRRIKWREVVQREKQAKAACGLPSLASVTKAAADDWKKEEARRQARLVREKAALERKEYRKNNPNWFAELQEQRRLEREQEKQEKERLKAHRERREAVGEAFREIEEFKGLNIDEIFAKCAADHTDTTICPSACCCLDAGPPPYVLASIRWFADLCKRPQCVCVVLA